MAAIDDLTIAVNNMTNAVSDAAAELKVLAGKIGASIDPAVAALAAQVEAQASALEQSVTDAKTANP